MCKSNRNCSVIHTDGICPWKNECDCDFSLPTEDTNRCKHEVMIPDCYVCYKSDTNTLREELKEEVYVEVMEDYLFLAKMHHLAKDPAQSMEDMRASLDKLVDFIINKFNQKLEEIEELLEKEKIEFDSSDTLVKKVFDSHNQALDVALQIIKNKKN